MHPAQPPIHEDLQVSLQNFFRDADVEDYSLLAVNVATLALTAFSSYALFGAVGAFIGAGLSLALKVADFPSTSGMITGFRLRLQDRCFEQICADTVVSSLLGAIYFQGWGSIPCLAITALSFVILFTDD